MFKSATLIFLLFCLSLHLKAAESLRSNTEFISILKLSDTSQQERKLVRYILSFYESRPLENLVPAKEEMDLLFIKYNISNRPALHYFIEYSYQQRLLQVDLAEKALVKAIQQASKTHDNYLLYAFYNELAFLQTYRGNTTEAVYSFSISKKLGILMNNPSFQVVVDINISDIFYKNSFYKQSLFYLEQARELIAKGSVPETRLPNIIYNNIAENYFRMNSIDSVRKYNRILHELKDDAYKKYIFTKRTDYYLDLLKHDYKKAIKELNSLKTDALYRYDNVDEQNLADAYFNANMPDSSKAIINRLLASVAEDNHPEVKFHLYEVLGKIAEQRKDTKAAAYNFKMALQQSEEQIGRLTQVDNISSQIKIDEAEGFFIQKEEGYKKERLGLIFVLIIAFLTVAVIAMIFNATRQKRYYEKLLFEAKKDELSFINSHEVRRHLCNILGLISVIQESDDKQQEYLHAEDYILREVENLDGAIKTIAEKLTSEID